eukprot:CAMPEP_0185574874 /NCGR_PEP_ID=MMETSP0434-20130131/6225_1 /TAXON_ID=626734 ORGANISM="Favella taraikaensis, Strain Fe Narragansett Bay" /NCGR_SAMPLE_ID=MMETSP0434 /ASSEMBLY_ACC=CAM_ASM_000379 /LENGTH=79 /DNA_ID=CAMNT_0028191585 /DNA_START=1404 /DNA_END=1644 /DNA_ORIENTATION=-
MTTDINAGLEEERDECWQRFGLGIEDALVALAAFTAGATAAPHERFEQDPAEKVDDEKEHGPNADHKITSLDVCRLKRL